eukprot:364272-Chlamydomonas_euryale.AAC.2
MDSTSCSSSLLTHFPPLAGAYTRETLRSGCRGVATANTRHEPHSSGAGQLPKSRQRQTFMQKLNGKHAEMRAVA